MEFATRVTFEHVRNTAAALAAANPVLGYGVIGYETDSRRCKFGDGSTAYNSLTYLLSADAVTDASLLTTGTVSDALLSSAIARVAGIALNQNITPYMAETFNRSAASMTNVPTQSGQATWGFFSPLTTFTATQISMVSGTGGSGITLAKFGLYTFDDTTATLVAQTANDNTLFSGTNTLYTRSLVSSYTLNAGSRYGVACLFVATSPPQFIGSAANTFALAITPKCSGKKDGYSDMPSTASSFDQTNVVPWARVW